MTGVATIGRGVAALALAAGSLLAAAPSPAPTAPAAAEPSPLGSEEAIRFMRERWTGDLDGIIKRRMLRVLTAYSKTGYFLDGIEQKGVNADAFREFETELNAKLHTNAATRVHVLMIPVSRDELLTGVVQGRGDLASANLTITAERERLVGFSEPVLDDVSEIAVTARGVPEMNGPEDLSGREVHVRASSSFFESLARLNRKLTAAGKPPVKVVAADEFLENEDLLEMVNAGLIPATVVDSHIARFWAQIFDGIEVHEKAAVSTGGRIGIAFRKGTPKLAAALNEFVRKHRAGTTYGNLMLQKYLKKTDFVRNAASNEEMKRFQRMVEFFRKYAGRYGFDYLMVAAQGYQESRLDQSKRSPSGAIGVMQLLPETAKSVGVPNIRRADANIDAGVRYLRKIYDTQFKDSPMSPLDKGLFCFAAYNAGPTRVAQLRRKAEASGYDPNKWFRNVEVVAAREIGRETVQYVSNIYKYYVSYRLVLEHQEKKPKA